MPAFTVSSASAADRPAACRLLVAHRSPPEQEPAALRHLDLLGSGEFDPAGLFAAKDGAGVVRGAMLTQAMPGALGLAWPPRTEPGRDPRPIEDALVAAACDWLRAGGVKVCQAFGSEAERPDFAALERHGFRRITQVTYMRRDVPTSGVNQPPGELIPFAADPASFTAALLLSYDGSRDCPELTGHRTTAEMLDGFRGNGLLGGDWWFTLIRGGPLGVALWEPGTEPGVLEVSYLGLIPTARGKGLGDELVRRSLAFAQGMGFHALNLSVDVRNEPALRLYRRHGFTAYDRKDVYLATLHRGEPGA